MYKMIKEKWDQYAQFWSMAEDDRKARLAEVATPDVTYTDPNVTVSGAAAFSDHIGQFQKDIPGGRFVITGAFEHHQRTLAHWDMLGADGFVMIKGTSFADLNEEGKFASFTGFFGGA